MLFGQLWELWFALAVVIAMVYGLARNWAADMITTGCLTLILLAGLFPESGSQSCGHLASFLSISSKFLPRQSG